MVLARAFIKLPKYKQHRTMDREPSGAQKQDKQSRSKKIKKHKAVSRVETNLKLAEDDIADKTNKILNLAEIKHKTDDLICSICLNFICCSVTTVCGHTFCEICIYEYLLYFVVN